MSDHAVERILERAPGLDPALLDRLRQRLYSVNLPVKPSHVALHDPAGVLRGYAVIKRVGKRGMPVIATVLGPEMTPPGKRVLMDKAAADVSPWRDAASVFGNVAGGGLLGMGAGGLAGAGLGGGIGALASLLSRGRLPLQRGASMGAALGVVPGVPVGTLMGLRAGAGAARRGYVQRHHPLLYPFIENLI